MSLIVFGRAYKTSARQILPLPVAAASADISVGDLLFKDANGFYKQAAAGEIASAVACQAVTSPSADGDVHVKADVSRETLYRYPPDAGSVTQAITGKTCDVGGPQSIDIDATVDDCIEIVAVDVPDNFVIVRIKPTLAGV